MKTLIFGAMPHGATPQTHLAAGAWCFCGQEDNFPHWWKEDGFPLPNDPFTQKEEMQRITGQANAEALRLTQLLGAQLAAHHKRPYNNDFWEMALSPWLLLCTHVLAERQARVQALVSLYNTTELSVPLLAKDSCHYTFTNSLDFMLHGVLDQQCNFYIFSRMVEAMAPSCWKLQYAEPATLIASRSLQVPPAPNGFKHTLKQKLSQALTRLPFPLQKGFSLPQSLYLSLAVLFNNNQRDNTLPFSTYCSTPLEWQFPAEELINQWIPSDLYTTPIPAIGKNTHKLRGMTAAFSQSEQYRIFLGAWLEGGGKLFSIQHGANYGNLHTVGIIPFEYKQHAFFSWGWSQQHSVKANAIPLPNPALTRIYNTHSQQNDTLILVGTEMSPYSYRLKSRPAALQQIAYRNRKIDFFADLDHAILAHSQYRPYPTAGCGLEDAAFVQKALPHTQICTGNLTAHMLHCKLLVLDHYGTTLHMALAANTPTVCFWHPNDWGMDEYSTTMLQTLRNAGILYDSPHQAAQHINAIWGKSTAWWQQPSVQQARQEWLAAFALCSTQATGKSASTIAPTTTQLIQHWFSCIKSC